MPCPWAEEIRQVDPSVELPPDSVAHRVDSFGAVVCGIDVHPEGPLPLGESNDANDLAGDLGGIGVGRRQFRELCADLIHQSGVVGLVGARGFGVGGVAGVGEVMGTCREAARYDDHCVDAEASELRGVGDSEGVLGSLRRKVGGQVGGVPPRVLDEPTQTSKPSPRSRM
jgi:hypothetical protein